MLTQYSACPNANLLGTGHDEDLDLFCANQAAASFPVKQPGWVLFGDGHLHSVVPVLGRACTRSRDLRTAGWSCWMWRLAEQALEGKEGAHFHTSPWAAFPSQGAAMATGVGCGRCRDFRIRPPKDV